MQYIETGVTVSMDGACVFYKQVLAVMQYFRIYTFGSERKAKMLTQKCRNQESRDVVLLNYFIVLAH